MAVRLALGGWFIFLIPLEILSFEYSNKKKYGKSPYFFFSLLLPRFFLIMRGAWAVKNAVGFNRRQQLDTGGLRHIIAFVTQCADNLINQSAEQGGWPRYLILSQNRL